jgi:hypothetical protein
VTDQIRGPSRQATAEIIARFANTGRDDPTIAARLGITAAQVRGLRRQFGIPAGDRSPRGRQGGMTKEARTTLAEIKRQVRPGQAYRVTNHRLGPEFSPVTVRVARLTGDYGFYVEHTLGETKITWPPARHVTRDDDGTLRLRATGLHAGEPYLTFVPVAAATAGEGNGQ